MRDRPVQVAILVAVLSLAGALRFTGLTWGLRHTPDWDESVFVENAGAMVHNRSLDHRFYQYPGLLFYLLAPLLALSPRGTLESPDAYVVARGLIASFSVLSVGLVYVLGSRYAGAWAGLSAALLLAVSPLEVVTAHMVRPDVALEAFVLLALLAFRRVGAEARGDAVAGAAIGAATALKFTGLLVVPSYLVARWLAPGPRLRRVILAGALAVLVTLTFTPYALVNSGRYLHGVRVQMGAHYSLIRDWNRRDWNRREPNRRERNRQARSDHGSQLGADHEDGGRPPYAEHLAFYLGVVPWAFGPLGALLLVAGLGLGVREWRKWAPLLAHPLTTLAVMATADRRYERFLVPTAGTLAVVAGQAVAQLAGRAPRAAAALALVAAALPLQSSLSYVCAITPPSTMDRAVDWIEAHVPPGARVLTTVPDLGLDRERYEVLIPMQWEPEGRILSREADLVVTAGREEDARQGLRTLFASTSPDPHRGPAAQVRLPILLQRPQVPAPYVAVPVVTSHLRASENTPGLSWVSDGRLDTLWQTEQQRGSEWIEVDFGRSVRLARVELLLGERSSLYGRNLHLLVSDDRRDWRRLTVVAGRPPVEEQVGVARSQVLLVDPTEVRQLRIAQVGRRLRPWAIAELRIAALP